MRQLHQILVDLKKRSVQHHLDVAIELKSKLEDFFHVMEASPPKLEGSRILLLMAGMPRCLNAAMYALRLAQTFNATLYVLHKGILAPLLLEHAKELQITITFNREVGTLTLVEIEQLVEDQAIDFIVASGRLPLANRLLAQLSLPILFTKHPIYSKR